MAVAAGLVLEAAVSHGMVGLSRQPRDAARLAFAIASAAVAAGSLSVLAMYSADTPRQHLAIMKWAFFPASVVWIVAAVWFVAFYTRTRPTRWLLALTTGYGVILVVNFLLPLGLLHSEVGEMRAFQIAGSQVMLAQNASPHVLNIVTEALNMAALAFVGYAVYRAYRGGNRRRADHVTLAALVFSFAAVLDALTDYGVVSSLYATQLCFAGVVVATSVALRRESLKTETELATYRDNLEVMVEARVWELDRANQRLALEVQERLRAEELLQRRVEELDGLQRVSQTLADRSDLAAALDDAAGQITALFKACHSRVYLLDDEDRRAGGEPAFGDSVATPAATAVQDSLLFKQAIESRGVVTVEQPASAPLPADLAELVSALDVRYLLLSPMVARGNVVGVLAIARDGLGGALTSEETTLARTVAETLAAVVESERLHQRETRQAAEDERQRLARDLHDAVTQSIYSATLIAEALPAVWEREPMEGLANLVRLRRLVRAALAEMRTLLFELRPGALEAAQLDTLLERLGDALGGQAQIPVEVDVADGDDLPPEVKITLYRVAQEGFSNIAKHARATRARASLTANEREVVLTVEDEGRGFDPGAIAPERMGLRIMRERLDHIGASLDVTSQEGKGTRLVAVWPRPGATGSPHDGQTGDQLIELARSVGEGEA